jgi:hypothetical protein
MQRLYMRTLDPMSKFHHFPLMSCHTFTENLFRNPLVSITGRITLMKVEAKTQMNEMTIQPVKKPREKM